MCCLCLIGQLAAQQGLDFHGTLAREELYLVFFLILHSTKFIDGLALFLRQVPSDLQLHIPL
ncbi:hypothetical protein SORBI_3008G072550 [Sorghum bicolor]|uniref:Uncharacterized protein n=1 Tax=Sorghum bicolor TaxID=4558 RepID=A0A1Z5R570_SORBI|nr:hypothetical protein SORBI_3008G072550 [Sorghum bicolor]